MGIKIRHLSPELERALGFHFLLRFFQGEHIAGIARSTHTSRRKVRRVMKKAAATMVDAAQQTLLAEVFPLAVDVIKAALNQQLEKAKEGKPIDTGLVERLLKGMFITDSPQLRTQLMQDATDNTIQTLEGFIASKVLISPRTTIEAEKVD